MNILVQTCELWLFHLCLVWVNLSRSETFLLSFRQQVIACGICLDRSLSMGCTFTVWLCCLVLFRTCVHKKCDIWLSDKHAVFCHLLYVVKKICESLRIPVCGNNNFLSPESSCRVFPWKLPRVRCLPPAQDDLNFTFYIEEIWHPLWPGMYGENFSETICRFSGNISPYMGKVGSHKERNSEFSSLSFCWNTCHWFINHAFTPAKKKKRFRSRILVLTVRTVLMSCWAFFVDFFLIHKKVVTWVRCWVICLNRYTNDICIPEWHASCNCSLLQCSVWSSRSINGVFSACPMIPSYGPLLLESLTGAILCYVFNVWFYLVVVEGMS